MLNPVKINSEAFNKLKVSLGITEDDMYKPPKILSDRQLQSIAEVKA